MEMYSCMDTLSNVMWLHPEQKRNPKVLSPIFADPRSRKMRYPNSSARSPLTRDLSGLGFIELQNEHGFTTCWRSSKCSRNVHVSRPLLELRGRHVVVLQMNVPQVALVRQLADQVAGSFTFCLSDRSRDILCSLTRVP